MGEEARVDNNVGDGDGGGDDNGEHNLVMVMTIVMASHTSKYMERMANSLISCTLVRGCYTFALAGNSRSTMSDRMAGYIKCEFINNLNIVNIFYIAQYSS